MLFDNQGEECGVRPEDFRSGKTTFSDLAYKYILDGILSFQFRPGDSLRVRDLAQLFGVSPTPIERALERLAGEGLVEFRSGLGPFVVRPTLEDVLDLYDARLMFELYAVERGIERIDDAFVAKLDELVEKHAALLLSLRQQYEYRTHFALNEADRNVHQHIIRLWPNRKILNWYSQANVHIKAFQIVGDAWFYRQTSADEHRAICQAFHSRKLSAIICTIKDHEGASSRAFVERASMAGAPGDPRPEEVG